MSAIRRVPSLFSPLYPSCASARSRDPPPLRHVFHMASRCACLFLVFLSFFLIETSASLVQPNPCAFGYDGNPSRCARDQDCVVENTRDKRVFSCRARLSQSCFCPLIFEPVCCRVSERESSITRTVENSCSCGCLKNGYVLFDSSCSEPPMKPVLCDKAFARTCCYLGKFDLTFMASNPCTCSKASDGITVDKSVCETLETVPVTMF